MKKLILLLFCYTIIFSGVSAQTSDSSALKAHYLKVYDQALVYNDVNAAINALHGYIAIDNNLLYKDTMSMLYFSIKLYYSALILSEEVYKKILANIDAMARAAECYDELGDSKTSVSLFEQVCPKTKNVYHYYKLALGQYQLKRTAECEATVKIIMADSTSKKTGVNFQMADGSRQAVPLIAAAANLLGVMQMDLKNYEAGKTYFKQALAFFPQFGGAQQNMKICEEKSKGAVKTSVKTPVTKPKG